MDNIITWEHLENAPSPSTPPSSGPITPNNEVIWGYLEDVSTPTSHYSGPTDSDNEITWEHLEDVSSCSSIYERDDEAVMDKRFSALYALHDPEPVSSLEVLQDMPLKALFLHVVAVFILWLVWLLFLIKMLGRELRLLEQKRLI